MRLFRSFPAYMFFAVVIVCALSLLAHDEAEKPVGNGNPGFGINAPIAATPCVNNRAGQFPCAGLDLLAFLPNTMMGSAPFGSTPAISNDLWGWADPMTGREYALVGLGNGTAFVDITAPETPVYLGILPTHSSPSIWRGIKTYGNFVYIGSEATGHGIQVFDLTQLRGLSGPPRTFIETFHYSGLGRSHNIAINTDERTDGQPAYLYATGSADTCSGGLHMVSLADPARPTFAGCYASDGYTHDAQCVMYNGPDVAHRGKEVCFNSNEDTLTIVEVTNKSAPVMLSRTGYSGRGYTHQGWLTGDQAYFLVDDELDESPGSALATRTHLWDVSDLEAPRRTAVYEGPSRSIDHNQYIKGNYSYQANYRSGLRVLDVANAQSGSLREAAYFDVYPTDDNPNFDGSWNNYPYFPSGNLIVNGIESGLFILRPAFTAGSMGTPNFQTRAQSADATVRAGGTASYQFTITPQNNFSGALTFSCAGLPAGAACSSSPAQLSVSGTTAANMTLTITTTGASAALQPTHRWWAMFASLFGVVGMVAGASGQGRRRLRMALLALCVVSGLLLLPSCGGDSAAPPPPPAATLTPAGTHAVRVIASSGSMQHSADVTLTVQ